MHIPLDHAYAWQLHEWRKRLLDDLSSVQLTELVEGFPHGQVIPRATYSPWRSNAAFMALLEAVSDATLVDRYRLFELYSLMQQMRGLPGDVLEVGVWRGGSAAILGAAGGASLPSKLWLADTFSGVPNTKGGRDPLYRGGEHADCSADAVHSLLTRCGVTNFELLVGRFPEDTGARIGHCRFKFAHIDVDTYESAAGVFRWVWPRMAMGSVIVFDDYGFWGCEGVTAFVNQLSAAGLLMVHNLNGHAVVFKGIAEACDA
jgi:O-methyltransferase